MEFTIENLEKLKGNSQLIDEVIESLLEQYEDIDDLRGHIQDILTYGCISGCVSSLITYNQTTTFYEKHQSDIKQLLEGILKESGINHPSEMFSNWEQSDPLCLDLANQNTLAWFGYEETLRQITYHFEDLA